MTGGVENDSMGCLVGLSGCRRDCGRSHGRGHLAQHLARCVWCSRAGLRPARAVGEDSRLKEKWGQRRVIAAASARQMSLVWVWGAACLVIIYLTLLQWREWWDFFTAFAVAGVVSLWLSFMLER